jgi:sulfur-oxidizing protein SoxY
MQYTRRHFLQSSTGGAALLALVAAGLVPTSALAAEFVEKRAQFDGKTLDEVVKALGGSAAQQSAEIQLKAPEIAENGATVPVEVTSNLPGTKSISLLSEKNPHALSATFQIPDGTEPYVSTRVKVAETSKLYALVQTDKGFFYTDQIVKVTLGGCGG